MGATRYFPVQDYTDDHGRTYRAGVLADCVTGSQYERLGEPDAFRPADFPEEVEALREEYKLPAELESVAPTREQLEAATVEQLRESAGHVDISGRSTMTKAELVDALHDKLHTPHNG